MNSDSTLLQGVKIVSLALNAPSQIGPYLRRFIREHHDTLAVAIK